MKKIVAIILTLIVTMSIISGCISPLKEIKEVGEAMEEGLGLIDEEKTQEFYKKSCSYINANGLSDSFTMLYEKCNDKVVTVEYNSICKGVLIEYIYGSDSYGDAILFKEGATTLVHSEKNNNVSEIETTWDDYSEYSERFNITRSALLEVLKNLEPDCCEGYEIDDELPYVLDISYKGKDVKKLNVLDFDIDRLIFSFSCDKNGEVYDEFFTEIAIGNSEIWRIWFGDNPDAASSYEEMKEDFDLKL